MRAGAILAVLVVLVVIGSGPVGAQDEQPVPVVTDVTAEQLIVSCQSGNVHLEAFCYGYINAVASVVSRRGGALGMQACPPADLPLRGLAEAFSRAWVQVDQDDLSQPAWAAVAATLEAGWPCR